MVMLEGVSYSDGTLVGDMIERGSFGSIRDFLLSDRWFDYEKYKLDSSIELQTQSGLARAIEDHVKELGSQLKIPAMPVRPNEPSEPVRPEKGFFHFDAGGEPTLSLPPRMTRFETWLAIRLSELLWLFLFIVPVFILVWPVLWDRLPSDLRELLLSTADEYIVQDLNVLLALLALLVIWLLYPLFIADSFYEKKTKQEEKRHKKRVEKWKRKRVWAAKSDKKFAEKLKEYDRDQALHRKAIDEWPEILEASNEVKIVWIEERKETLSRREKLWDELRVCLRCGSIYFKERPAWLSLNK